MRLRYQVLLYTGLIWLLFIIFSIVLINPIDLMHFVIFSILFYLLLYGSLYVLIIKRLEQLKQDLGLLTPVNKNQIDEIALLSIQLHHVFHSLNLMKTKLEHSITESEQTTQPFLEPKQSYPDPHLTKLVHYDPLTTLPNRIFFNEMLNKAICHARRHQKMLAILLIDIDHFNYINNELGHDAGNRVLKEMANRFSAVIRHDDILARFGGDEFIILLNDISHPKMASYIATKILEACITPFEINDQHFFLTPSIGICIFPQDGTSLESLQKHADLALYKAKYTGGNTYLYFTKEMTSEAQKHLNLDHALRNAIKRDELILHYQPIFDLIHHRITRLEALLRWVKPDIGIVTPEIFIPLAEESGFIIQLGKWVLQEACRINKAWQDQGFALVRVAVNLSSKQFNHPDIVHVIATALEETGLHPNYLELEISESTMMNDVVATQNKLAAIKQLGVKICMDSFGTGYTSINYLKHFSIDTLKIDQAFIRNISVSQDDLAITSTIIDLGHHLGIKVVAEGVETVEQVQLLTENQCDLVQGYYFSRPVSAAKIILQLDKVKNT